jgi:hypothetical protein
MDRSLRQASAVAFLAAGCVFSTSSRAYSAAEDAEAQDREVKAAYDRGYQAAKQELAHAAASKPAAAAATPPAAAASAQPSPAAPPRKPILDIKHVYSDASEVETVREVPVTVKPLPDKASAQTPAPDEARVAAQQPTPPTSPAPPAARRSVAVAADASADDSESLQNPPPVPRPPHVQARDAGPRRPAIQQQAAPPEEVADDEGDDAGMPAQAYAPEPQYARPRTVRAATRTDGATAASVRLRAAADLCGDPSLRLLPAGPLGRAVSARAAGRRMVLVAGVRALALLLILRRAESVKDDRC